MPEVDHVVGNAEKLRPETWRTLASGAQAPRLLVGDIMAARATPAQPVEGLERRTRAILQVQQGCDHRCTFCVIPFGRGPSRSVPLPAIVAQARALVAAGYVEFVITGVDLTSYGRDLPGQPTLGAMLSPSAGRGAGAAAAAPVVARSGGDRRRAVPAGRRGAAAAAASPSVRPGRPRPGAQAHEAAPRARRRGRGRRASAPVAAGPRLRRGSDRRLPDRGRGDVPEHAGPGRRGGADLPARVSLLAPPGHAGGAHAAGGRGESARSARHACGRAARAAAGRSWWRSSAGVGGR